MAYNGKLRQAIKDKNLTQKEFAEKLGINEGWMSGIVSGTVSGTTVQRNKIAKALNMTVDELFAEAVK